MNQTQIIIADDDPSLVTLLERHLGKAGYTVSSFSNGNDAFDLVAGKEPVILLADWEMPGMTGVELCRKIRASSPDDAIYVILLTCNGEPEQVLTGFEAGADDFLVKPARSAELLARIRAGERVLKLLLQQREDAQALQSKNADLEGGKQRAEEALFQLKQAQTKMSQAGKMEAVGQLAAGIAHEVNTPTQFIGDNTRFLEEAFDDVQRLLAKYAQLLEANRNGSVTSQLIEEVGATLEEVDMEYLAEEIPKSIKQSIEGLQRVAKIVRAMKEFSHPGGKEKEPVDLNKTIESTITVSRNEWKYVAEMVTDFDASLPEVPCLVGDLNQVFLNMIVNAAHAIAGAVGDDSSDKGMITVSTRRDGDWVEIRIGDTGTGIPKETQSRIFDPFFTTKEMGKGTGQGLSIAHHVVVEKHGGTITFETEVGQGTTFIICLPLTSEEVQERERIVP